jgi:hypothetical protein
VNALLGWLSRVNRTGVFLAVLALVLGGLLLPGPAGGLVLLVLAGGLGALLTVTWARHGSRTRLIRVAALTLLIGVAVIKIV